MKRLAPLWLFLLAMVATAPAMGRTVWQAEVGVVDLDVTPADTPEARYAHAVGLIVTGDYAAAAEMLSDSLERFPDSPQAGRIRYRLAECDLELKKYDRTCRLCTEILTVGARRAVPSSNVEPGPPDEAAVRRLRFAAARALARRDAAAGLAWLGRIAAPEENDTDAAGALWVTGAVQMMAGHYDESADALHAVRQRFPGSDYVLPALWLAAQCRLREARVEVLPGVLEAAVSDFEAYRDLDTDAAERDRANECAAVARNAGAADDLPARAVYLAIGDYVDAKTLLPPPGPRPAGSPRSDGSVDTNTPAAVIAETREHLLQRDARGRLDDDYAAFKRGAKKLPPGPVAEIANFYKGLALETMGDTYAAYKAFEVLLTDYPATGFLRAAVEAEYRLGKKLYEADSGKCATVLESVVEHDPLGPQAADAESTRGDYYFAHGDYLAAREAYEAVLDYHGRSAYVPRALVRRGACALRLTDTLVDDTLSLNQAHDSLTLYLTEFPGGELVAEAKALLAETEERLAGRLWEIARFYRRRDEPGAERIYLELLVAQYPQTKWRQKAEDELKTLPAKEPSHAS